MDVRVEDRSAGLVKPGRKGPPCTYYFRRRWRSDEAPINAGNLIRKGRLPGTMPVATRSFTSPLYPNCLAPSSSKQWSSRKKKTTVSVAS
jgi:hypothetical protein